MNDTEISSLPRCLRAKAVIAHNSRLRSLPDDWKSVRELHVSQCDLRALPENLELQQLSLSNVRLKTIPASLDVAKTIIVDNSIIEMIEDTDNACEQWIINQTTVGSMPEKFPAIELVVTGDSKLTIPERMSLAQPSAVRGPMNRLRESRKKPKLKTDKSNIIKAMRENNFEIKYSPKLKVQINRYTGWVNVFEDFAS
jgi:hypothetical protein